MLQVWPVALADRARDSSTNYRWVISCPLLNMLLMELIPSYTVNLLLVAIQALHGSWEDEFVCLEVSGMRGMLCYCSELRAAMSDVEKTGLLKHCS